MVEKVKKKYLLNIYKKAFLWNWTKNATSVWSFINAMISSLLLFHIFIIIIVFSTRSVLYKNFHTCKKWQMSISFENFTLFFRTSTFGKKRYGKIEFVKSHGSLCVRQQQKHTHTHVSLLTQLIDMLPAHSITHSVVCMRTFENNHTTHKKRREKKTHFFCLLTYLQEYIHTDSPKIT